MNPSVKHWHWMAVIWYYYYGKMKTKQWKIQFRIFCVFRFSNKHQWIYDTGINSHTHTQTERQTNKQTKMTMMMMMMNGRKNGFKEKKKKEHHKLSLIMRNFHLTWMFVMFVMFFFLHSGCHKFTLIQFDSFFYIFIYVEHFRNWNAKKNFFFPFKWCPMRERERERIRILCVCVS